MTTGLSTSRLVWCCQELTCGKPTLLLSNVTLFDGHIKVEHHAEEIVLAPAF